MNIDTVVGNKCRSNFSTKLNTHPSSPHFPYTHIVIANANPMKKQTQLPITTTTTKPFPKIFESKPLIFTLLTLTFLTLLYNLQPYNQTIIQQPCDDDTITTTTNTPSNNPNKRLFKSYGNAAALFVQMGAYRGSPTTFAVVGLASKPSHVYSNSWYKCEYVANNNASYYAKAFKMLPDWGYGRVYTVVVVNCTFDVNPNVDNLGGTLVVYAYYNEFNVTFEKFDALVEKPGSYDERKYYPPYKYEYLYCGSSLYGDINARRMREWMAYHAWFFKESSHFVFHDAGGVSEEVKAVLDPWIKAGRVTLQDVRGQAEFDGYYYNQFLIVNDCLHRYRHSANWTFYFDVDEYIYLPDGKSLEYVLSEFGNNTQFTIEQNAMSSSLCLNDQKQNYSREWGFEKLLFKDPRTEIRRDRKYAIQARNAYATGVHMSENVIGGTLHKTETEIRYFHYHNSITIHEELCRNMLPISAKNATTWMDKIPYVYDDSMKKLAPIIKSFEHNTIGDSLQKRFQF